MSGLLQVSQARICYGKVEAVRGVSLVVGESEIVTIIGANGAGKTTLLNAVMGILPLKGRLTFAGQNLDRFGSRIASAWDSAWCPSIASCSPP